MNLFDILLLAVALGVDCFVVSFSQGLFYCTDRIKTALKLAITMGLFQGLMPIIGYVGADYMKVLLRPYSKLIVFIVFMLLGMQFILEAMKKSEDKKIHCLSIGCLLSLGVATSIDALVSGVSLNYTLTTLPNACIIIGLVSFLMSLAGFYITNLFKKIKINYLQFAGGLILIFLAAKVFYF